MCAALLSSAVSAGCSPGGGSTTSAEPTKTVGANMAGPVVDVNVSPAAIAAKPKPWVLTTPEAAVRSYLDWTSYAYRIAQSGEALPTMTTYEEVRVDSYVQYNIQKKRLIDQTLDSIEFGTPSIKGTDAVVTADEAWTYRYVSIETAGKVLEGPYTAKYETTYTLVKSKTGWRVDSVEAKALGEVK